MSDPSQVTPHGADDQMDATDAPAPAAQDPTLPVSSASEPSGSSVQPPANEKPYRIPKIAKVFEKPARTAEEKEACKKAKRKRYNARKNAKKRAEGLRTGKKKRKTPFVLQYPRPGQITTMANFERMRAKVATRIMVRQANGEDLPLSLWSCSWAGWTQPGSAEERTKAKRLHPEQRMGYGEWGFQSSTNYNNLAQVLGDIIEKELGGKDVGTAPEPPGMKRRLPTQPWEDEGPTVVSYIPQDVWEELEGSSDGARKITLLTWMEKQAGFKMDNTSILHSKMVVSSTGAEEQQLIIKPGEDWLKSASQHPEGLDTPWGNMKFMSRAGKEQKCQPIRVAGSTPSPDKGETSIPIRASGSTLSPDKEETSKKRNRSTDDSGRGKGKAKKPLFDEDEEELLSCFESAAEETPQKGNEDGNESEEEYAVTYMQ